MKMSKKILAAAAIVLPLSIGTGSALAYFTANTIAEGGAMVAVGTNTEIIEKFDSWTKHVTIKNNPEGGAVYVRVQAFTDAEHDLIYEPEGLRDDNWYNGNDGYWYYRGILAPGATTDTALDIKITNKSGEPNGDAFNVVVVYEQIPVIYGEGGNEQYRDTPHLADWTGRLIFKDISGNDPTTKTP